VDKIELAEVLEKIANGINPETGKPDEGSKILATTTSIRALFNAAILLRNDAIDEKPEQANKIEFYRTNGKYGCFSNFSKHAFTLDNKLWPTSEHYFQAKKFEGEPDEEEIRLSDSPNSAAKMGRQRTRPLRVDWEQVKDDVMYTALKAKFTQNQSIRIKLIETEDAEIVEHTKNDSYWGDAGDGSGKNMLGKLLMRLRTELVNV
jgi:ribA/ribD-fused uncharacterized protein